MIYDALKITPSYDIELDDSGMVSWQQDAQSVADRAFFDVSSNNNWVLDKSLGINWIDEIGTGLLQIKNPEVPIINALERKLSTIGGIQSVDEIAFLGNEDRHLSVQVTCTVEGGEKIKISSEVSDIDY